MKFIDEIKIKVSSGHGGPGAISFRRESGTPRGGPDGGDGGKGGDLVFKTSKHLNSLVDLNVTKHYLAQDGKPGSSANSSGAAGSDMVILVPEGTVIKNMSGETIVDLTREQSYILLSGGRGGKGNAFFKTSVNQAPEKSQPGEEGSTLDISLELKLIADVGIIGFPNAGKSTLISRISAARPKIADYPFTTLTPNLGVVKAADFKSFVVADIPGLVKGAHQGVGLGIQFLRHIERTKIFIHLVDASGLSGRDPMEDYRDINFELSKYDENNKGKEGFFPLMEREQMLVFNKIDTLNSEALNQLKIRFKKHLGFEPLMISAVSGKNIKELIHAISRKIFKEV